MQFELTLYFDYIDTTLRQKIKIRQKLFLCSISIMMLIGSWGFMGTPTQNGAVTVNNNETTPLLPDSLLSRFTKLNESLISETSRDSEKSSDSEEFDRLVSCTVDVNILSSTYLVSFTPGLLCNCCML